MGELELRNPTLMRGYYEMPDETAAVLVDGWLRTGDLVTANPDGTYTFVGRRKEVIRRRGENLSPTEVEAALDAHPDVAESAVIGVESELSEQDVKAFVVPAAGRSVDLAALDAFARERLARVQGAPLLRGRGRDPPHPHRPAGQAPAAGRSHTRRGRHGGPSGGRSTTVTDDADWLRTSIGSTDADTITVGGLDLPSEIMGRLSLTELAYLLLVGRGADGGGAAPARRGAGVAGRPRADPERAGRPAHLHGRAGGDPGGGGGRACSARGACSSGRRGTPRSSWPTLLAGHEGPVDDRTLRELAEAAVDERARAGARVPGLGHPVHRVEDPRTPRLRELAEAEGLFGPHLRLLRPRGRGAGGPLAVGACRSTARGRRARCWSTSACRPTACGGSC